MIISKKGKSREIQGSISFLTRFVLFVILISFAFLFFSLSYQYRFSRVPVTSFPSGSYHIYIHTSCLPHIWTTWLWTLKPSHGAMNLLNWRRKYECWAVLVSKSIGEGNRASTCPCSSEFLHIFQFLFLFDDLDASISITKSNPRVCWTSLRRNWEKHVTASIAASSTRSADIPDVILQLHGSGWCFAWFAYCFHGNQKG